MRGSTVYTWIYLVSFPDPHAQTSGAGYKTKHVCIVAKFHTT